MRDPILRNPGDIMPEGRGAPSGLVNHTGFLQRHSVLTRWQDGATSGGGGFLDTPE
jgi:hypothetical protein